MNEIEYFVRGLQKYIEHATKHHREERKRRTTHHCSENPGQNYPPFLLVQIQNFLENGQLAVPSLVLQIFASKAGILSSQTERLSLPEDLWLFPNWKGQGGIILLQIENKAT